MLCAVAVAVSLPSGSVFADPAGPTDYRSEIASVEPPTSTISLAVLGGDSFVELTVESGTEVEVVGYRGEPYLRFDADGSVWENSRSPSTYLNAERYGTEFPEFADPDAPPEWRQIGSEGRWSWHDHRAHLMQPVPPFGTEPGDQILEAVVPLVVDGVEVDVTVISTWQPEPSSVPVWIGGLLGAVVVLVGAVLGGALVRGRRSPRTRRGGYEVIGVLPVSALATVVGWLQYSALPGETGPRVSWVAVPLSALIGAVVALVPLVRRDHLIRGALIVICGGLLVAWAWLRRDGLTAAIVPTSAPNWLDRGATALGFTGGVSAVVVGVVVAGGFGSGAQSKRSANDTLGTETVAATT